VRVRDDEALVPDRPEEHDADAVDRVGGHRTAATLLAEAMVLLRVWGFPDLCPRVLAPGSSGEASWRAPAEVGQRSAAQSCPGRGGAMM
jgi:hypothetical protein